MEPRRRREWTRQSFMPQQLRVLFIGESPPTGATFFYDANSVLFHATRAAFVPAAPKLGRQPDFLSVFARMGCYLEDISLDPIDKLPVLDKARRARTRCRTSHAGFGLASTRCSHALSSSWSKASEGTSGKHFDRAGLGEVPREDLPFPGQWHRAAYVGQLARSCVSGAAGACCYR